MWNAGPALNQTWAYFVQHWTVPVDTRHLINVSLTLVHRIQRWTTLRPTLIQLLVSAGSRHSSLISSISSHILVHLGLMRILCDSTTLDNGLSGHYGYGRAASRSYPLFYYHSPDEQGTSSGGRICAIIKVWPFHREIGEPLVSEHFVELGSLWK